MRIPFRGTSKLQNALRKTVGFDSTHCALPSSPCKQRWCDVREESSS